MKRLLKISMLMVVAMGQHCIAHEPGIEEEGYISGNEGNGPALREQQQLVQEEELTEEQKQAIRDTIRKNSPRLPKGTGIKTNAGGMSKNYTVDGKEYQVHGDETGVHGPYVQEKQNDSAAQQLARSSEDDGQEENLIVPSTLTIVPSVDPINQEAARIRNMGPNFIQRNLNALEARLGIDIADKMRGMVDIIVRSPFIAARKLVEFKNWVGRNSGLNRIRISFNVRDRLFRLRARSGSQMTLTMGQVALLPDAEQAAILDQVAPRVPMLSYTELRDNGTSYTYKASSRLLDNPMGLKDLERFIQDPNYKVTDQDGNDITPSLGVDEAIALHDFLDYYLQDDNRSKVAKAWQELMKTSQGKNEYGTIDRLDVGLDAKIRILLQLGKLSPVIVPFTKPGSDVVEPMDTDTINAYALTGEYGKAAQRAQEKKQMVEQAAAEKSKPLSWNGISFADEDSVMSIPYQNLQEEVADKTEKEAAESGKLELYIMKAIYDYYSADQAQVNKRWEDFISNPGEKDTQLSLRAKIRILLREGYLSRSIVTSSSGE